MLENTLDKRRIQDVLARWDLGDPCVEACLKESEARPVYRIKADSGRYILKGFSCDMPENTIRSNVQAHLFLGNEKGMAPAIISAKSGEDYISEQGYWFYLMEYVEGRQMEETPDDEFLLGQAARELHGLQKYGIRTPFTQSKQGYYEWFRDRGFVAEFDAILDAIPDFEKLDQCFVHTDLGPHNAMIRNDGKVIFIDLDDSGIGSRFLDLGWPFIMQFVDFNHDTEEMNYRFDLAESFLRGYYGDEGVTREEYDLVFYGAEQMHISYMQTYGPYAVDSLWKILNFGIAQKEELWNRMQTRRLTEILAEYYGIDGASVSLLREGGGRTYIVNSDAKYLLKVIGNAFAETARQSAAVMRYLEENDFPVPRMILTKDGDAIFEEIIAGEKKLIELMEFVEGDEPDMTVTAAEVGELVGWFHRLMDCYPTAPVSHGKDFFVGRYLDCLRRKSYPRHAEYEELGERLWERVKDLPQGICHGDLHRGNLIRTADGKIYLVDFDTVCTAPRMFDIMVMSDMTDYFNLKPEDIEETKQVYRDFLTGYREHHELSLREEESFSDWVAIRHYQLQATILEIHGIDCINEQFVDWQLYWLNKWLENAESEDFGANNE